MNMPSEERAYELKPALPTAGESTEPEKRRESAASRVSAEALPGHSPPQVGEKEIPDSEAVWRIAYAQATLEYTQTTNRNNENRLTKLLTVALGALAGNGILIQSLIPPQSPARIMFGLGSRPVWELGFAVGLLFMASVVSAGVFLWAVLVILRGIRPRTVDPESRLLNDWIESRTREEYITEISAHGAIEAQQILLRENRAMAGVVLSRQLAYKRANDIFYAGTVLMLACWFCRLFVQVT